MGIFKDFREDVEDYRFRTKIEYLFSPKKWMRLYKWRKQRADRGWSERDTWGAGDHIAKMVAEMLQYLQDNAYTDWPEWFKLNVREEGNDAYKDLQSVIDDIKNYLNSEEESWADDLYCKGNLLDTDKNEFKQLETKWFFKKNDRKLSEKQIAARIKEYTKEQNKKYKKAQKAMGFFSRHFSGFWD